MKRFVVIISGLLDSNFLGTANIPPRKIPCGHHKKYLMQQENAVYKLEQVWKLSTKYTASVMDCFIQSMFYQFYIF